MKKPFFSKFLENQKKNEMDVKGGATTKFPSDSDEAFTHKWPSDDDEDGWYA